ncbi:MAG: homoserine kinase [Actinomycetaceae bacterium]|nr:homoserine kinase [Actinomycetaceae bacterium]
MRLREDDVAVAVPATTANLGPGFDSMGMALDLWDEVRVRATTRGATVVVEGHGEGNVATGEDNLVVQALRFALDYVGAPQVGLTMYCRNRIPHGRGLGSSAAAIVAGLTLARALVGDPDTLTDVELLDLGTQMEGHPDNVAPAIMGGATIAWVEDGEAAAIGVTPPEHIEPVIFIPDFELPTEEARAALPPTIAHADAVHNISRAAALSAFLSSSTPRMLSFDTERVLHNTLMAATSDRLHQEQRRHTMEPSLALVDWLRSAGFAAVISGAGPTVLSLESVSTKVRIGAKRAGWEVMELSVPRQGVQILRGRLAKHSTSTI